MSVREIQKVKMMQRKWDNLLLKIRDPFVDSRLEILFFKQKKIDSWTRETNIKIQLQTAMPRENALCELNVAAMCINDTFFSLSSFYPLIDTQAIYLLFL